MSRIVITGLGVISSLGTSLEDHHEALIKGSNGLSSLELFKSKYAGVISFGEVKISNSHFKEMLGINTSGTTRTSLLALHACREAILDSRLKPSDIASPETALIVGNTVGGMCLTDELYYDANRDSDGSPYITSYDCGSVTLFLQNYYGIGGVCNTINTACSSSANALIFGARLIKNGYAKRAVVGGADSIAKFTINGFNALGILSPSRCKPFDKDRQGLNLGEGAGFIVLEREEDADPEKIYAYLAGYGNTSDAYHASSLSSEGTGPFMAMRNALDMAEINSGQIGYINTHGTGTENNDEVESRAMISLFKDVPCFASTKSKTGHTLGAAAAIEAVISILALHHQEKYPSLNFSSPIESTGLIPLLKYCKSDFRHVMTNSFGFGGNCSSLIFSKN